MKKLWLLLIALLLPIAAVAQIPASGFVQQFVSTALSGINWGITYSNFTTPTLPPGAVIVRILPAIRASYIGCANPCAPPPFTASSFVNFNFGTGMNNQGSGGNHLGGNTFSDFPSTLFFAPTTAPVIPPFFSSLTGMSIGANIGNSATAGQMTSQLTITGVGLAIYYTGPTLKIDRLLPPPVGIPTGQGLAWSVPTSFTTGGGPTPVNGKTTGSAIASLGNPNPIGFAHLTGIVKIPNMENFNGWLNIKMNRHDIKNTCNSPFLSVPARFSTYKIVDGIPIGLSNDMYASQDCTSPRVPYYVEVSDTNNIVQSTDNWYVPNQDGGTVDIGNMQESKFTGPIQVAIPQAIISTPIGNQTITQLPGTSLTINGTVNFTGTVGFITPIAFTTVSAQKVLVNGASGASAPLDVNGFINSSAGYLVGGSGGGIGQVLVSDGTSFKPGVVAVTFPSLFYQNVAVGGVTFPQHTTVAFDGAVFKGTDTASQTVIGMLPGPAGIANTYTNVNGFTLDSFGRVNNVTFASTGAIKSQDKIITSGICSTGTSSYAQCTFGPINWPVSFADTQYTITCQGIGPIGVAVTGLFVTGKTASSFGLIIQDGTSSGAHAVSFSEIDCHASHL